MPGLRRRDGAHVQHVELGLQHREATVLPSTFDAKARTAEVTWSTGARVRRFGFFSDDFYEELSLDPKHVRLDRLMHHCSIVTTVSSSTVCSAWSKRRG